jgi:hypothetical protein
MRESAGQRHIVDARARHARTRHVSEFCLLWSQPERSCLELRASGLRVRCSAIRSVLSVSVPVPTSATSPVRLSGCVTACRPVSWHTSNHRATIVSHIGHRRAQIGGAWPVSEYLEGRRDGRAPGRFWFVVGAMADIAFALVSVMPWLVDLRGFAVGCPGLVLVRKGSGPARR